MQSGSFQTEKTENEVYMTYATERIRTAGKLAGRLAISVDNSVAVALTSAAQMNLMHKEKKS